MDWTSGSLRAERHRLGRSGQAMIRAAIAYTRTPHMTLVLAEAIASRETGMQNIVGDGGHGRGMFQDDDRYLDAFLRSHVGCKSGSTIPIYASALPKGRVPTIFAGAVQLCRTIDANIAHAKRIGVPSGRRTKFALAAYNAGLGGAERGWAMGDADKFTAGRDYGSDTLAREHALKHL